MLNARHDVPVGILRSGIITSVLYILVVGGILLTLPVKALTTSGGLTAAFQDVNQAMLGTGGGARALGYFFGIVVILTLVASGSVWILGACRVQAVAALDGAAPRFLGRFSSQGTPSVMAWPSGIVGSVFVVVVFWVASSGGSTLNNAMAVFLGIALSTAVLAYNRSDLLGRRPRPDQCRRCHVGGGADRAVVADDQPQRRLEPTRPS
jgi:amino acid transporter